MAKTFECSATSRTKESEALLVEAWQPGGAMLPCLRRIMLLPSFVTEEVLDRLICRRCAESRDEGLVLVRDDRCL